MLDKDPTGGDWVSYLVVFVASTWAGLVRYIQSIKDSGVKFKFVALFYELIIAVFVGFITFFLCKYKEIDEHLMIALIAINSHMGTRAIYLLRQMIVRDK